MIKTKREIFCNLCGECFGEVDTRQEARRMMKDVGWRSYLTYDVCSRCSMEHNFPGLTSPQALTLLERMTREESRKESKEQRS